MRCRRACYFSWQARAMVHLKNGQKDKAVADHREACALVRLSPRCVRDFRSLSFLIHRIRQSRPWALEGAAMRRRPTPVARRLIDAAADGQEESVETPLRAAAWHSLLVA